MRERRVMYNEHEAKKILARSAGKLGKHSEDRYRESSELLRAVHALDGFAGFRVTVDGGELEVQYGNRMVRFGYRVADHQFVVMRGPTKVVVPLAFNPVEQRFEGIDEVGDPPEPRDALVVLVEALCAALEQ